MITPPPVDLTNCSIAATLSLIGEKWTILILRDVFSGVRRFDDFLERLQCSPAVLSARLKTLTEADSAQGRLQGARASGNASPTIRRARRSICFRPGRTDAMGRRHMAADGSGPAEVRSKLSGCVPH
jgi:hypothetical protein